VTLERLDALEEPPEAVLLDLPARLGLGALEELGQAAPGARVVARNEAEDDEEH